MSPPYTLQLLDHFCPPCLLLLRPLDPGVSPASLIHLLFEIDRCKGDCILIVVAPAAWTTWVGLEQTIVAKLADLRVLLVVV
jgi:hypothetical protein